MKTVSHNPPLAVLFFVTMTALISANAQITPSGDAYIDSTKPTINFGTAVTLGVVSPLQTTFIAFDLSSIPSGYTGSSIAKATLKLYVSNVTKDGSFNVDLVNGSWTESTLNANNAPALGATIAASVPLTKSQARDYVLIDITQALQDWLNGTPNDGIALVANSPFAATFESKENIKESHNAELDVVYAAGNGTITGVNTAAGSGLTGGGTSGTLNLSLLTSCSAGQTLAFDGASWGCKTAGGTGTVTSVGVSAPPSDFVVSGSPITTSGTLNIAWLVSPDPNNTANAIVKRDPSGSFNATSIKASGQISVNSGVSLVPILSVANAAGATAVAGYAQGTGYTVGVSGSSFSYTLNSSGVFGIDQNSAGSAGNYTTGVAGETLNKYGVGVLGYGLFSNNLTNSIGFNRAGVWGDDQTGVGVVATSDSGSAARALNTSSTFPTLVAQNNSTANAVVAVNTGTAAPTVLAQNTYNVADGQGLILRVEAPNVTVNGITAACQVNTRGDLGCSGDVVQTRPANGLMKALMYFDPGYPAGQQIVRCYNSLLPEPAATTPPCGFTLVAHPGAGFNVIDFGFTVSDRFVSATAVFVGGDSHSVAAELWGPGAGTQEEIHTFYTNQGHPGNDTDTPFFLTIF